MNCHFCNLKLDEYNCCDNHKFNIRYYHNIICFDINNQYTLAINKDNISIFDFQTFKHVMKVDKIFSITPDNVENILNKILSMKAFL